MKYVGRHLRANWLLFLFISILLTPLDAHAYGIDDMVGPQWRYGIFAFLVFGMVFYAFAVVSYMRNGRVKMKKGEFIMLSTILVGIGLGMLTAIVQLISGYLL
jgi:hypothetical protein